LGLSGVALTSGARSVLGTRSVVVDEATSELMTIPPALVVENAGILKGDDFTDLLAQRARTLIKYNKAGVS